MLTDYIQKSRVLLENHIETIFAGKKKSVPAGLHTFTDTLNHLQIIVPRGKLLRGVQILLAYAMFKGQPSTEVLNAAAALEIMQAAVLIQDDVMDNDYMRRGERSIFAKYSDVGKAQGTVDPLLYGQSMAVCVGDIGYFLAYELLSKISDDKEISRAVIELFSREWQWVGAGQMMDVDFSSRNYEPTEEEVMTVYTYKTARYSFSLPLVIGAILAGADQSTITKLDRLGETLGIIFQIKDDELGLYGEEKTIGKPVGSDIRENKKTLFRSWLMKKSTDEERKSLKNMYGNKNITEKEIGFVKNLIHSYGIGDDIQKKIETMSKEAIEIINGISADKIYKDLLREFVELNLRRIQ